MEKSLVIKRLQATVYKLKELPDEKFDYSNYVHSQEGGCGTVCCVAGWYPEWFPEANLAWDPNSVLFLCKRTSYGGSSCEIVEALSEYHGLDVETINLLFYGNVHFFFLDRNSPLPTEILSKKVSLLSVDPSEGHFMLGALHGSDSSREEVIDLFEAVLLLIEGGHIPTLSQN